MSGSTGGKFKVVHNQSQKTVNDSHYSSGSKTTDESSANTLISHNTDLQKFYLIDVNSDIQAPQTVEVTSGVVSSDQSTKTHKETIKLMPIKIKDVMEMFKTNPAYRDKSPVMINMKENDINRLIEQQRGGSKSPQQSLRGSPIYMQPMAEERSSNRKKEPNREPLLGSSFNEQLKTPFGGDQAQQVYAMTDIQAYPMVGTRGFRAENTNRMKSPRRRVSRHRRKKSRVMKSARSRSRGRPRGRSRRRKSRPRKVYMRRRTRSPVRVVRKKRYPPFNPYFCTPHQTCNNECIIRPPNFSVSRRRIGTRPSEVTMVCTCNLCQEKLQFIQPGVCDKKKYMWTNEYAVIPKKQTNFIDPCEQLDPAIYPRADNPCIRDGRGNPLTDCIGRPLRDPIGKRFLSFNGNGSLMDTNFRNNFYTGQPPICVKCPGPNSSCAPDTTHNWWMNCGYPIMPDMSPYFKQVFARENHRY